MFQMFEREQEVFNEFLSSASSGAPDCKGPRPQLDVAYALQLDLFTRAFQSDIYGGLRAGSWFAMSYSYFTRNCFSPFQDARALRLLLCRVPAENKVCPYEWYGRLYQQCVPRLFLEVPANNKLLCTHTECSSQSSPLKSH